MRRTLLVILSVFLPLTTTAEPTCEPCFFNTAPVLEDQDCSVYSAYDDSIQAWYRANETCLEALNISLAAVPKDRMWGMCPYANENEASNTLLTLFVRSSSSSNNNNNTAAQSIRRMYPAFFHNATLELLPTVPGTQGQIVNCTVSEDLCWNEFSILFALQPTELGRVCAQLHVAQKASLIQEQAAAREALCASRSNNDPTALDVCQPLWGQLQDVTSSCEGVSRVDYGSFSPPNCTQSSTSGASFMGTGLLWATLSWSAHLFLNS